MTTAVAFPYKMIPEDLLTLTEWERLDQSDLREPVADEIAGWDYDSEMNLSRSVELQPIAMIDSIGRRGSDARLSLQVTAETGPTSYRWIAFRTDIPIQLKWQHDIRLSVASQHLARRISLCTEIVLATNISDDRPFAASQLGSRLFRDARIVQLEGSLGRFPMEMIDFDKGLPFLMAQNALWYLDWDPTRPQSHFLGAVLLYINSAHAEVANLVQAAEPTILKLLRCDVIRTMCEAMLQNDEFLSNCSDYDSDTVGGQVWKWLLLAFGDVRPDALRNQLDSSPGRFEARLQNTYS